MSPPVSACPFCGVRARFRPDLDPPPLPRWTLRPVQSTSGQKSTEHGRAIAKWMLDLAERLREDTSSELNHALEVALESGPEEARTCR